MRSHEHEEWVRLARAVPIQTEIERRGIKLRRSGAELIGPCPRCGGEDRFAINTKKQVWNCRGCETGGDAIKLIAHLDNVDFITACTTLTGKPPPPKRNGNDIASKPREVVIDEFPYHGENGNVVLATERVEYQNLDGSFVLKDDKRKKTFRQKRPDPNRPGKWLYKVQGVRVVPYRLPDVVEAIANDHLVLVPEGEAKCNLLASWNLAATCNAGGAKNWKPEHAAFLKDADVVLVPDNDSVGWEHVHLVGASLVGIAKRIRVLVLPGLLPKGELSIGQSLAVRGNSSMSWSPKRPTGKHRPIIRRTNRKPTLSGPRKSFWTPSPKCRRALKPPVSASGSPKNSASTVLTLMPRSRRVAPKPKVQRRCTVTGTSNRRPSQPTAML